MSFFGGLKSAVAGFLNRGSSPSQPAPNNQARAEYIDSRNNQARGYSDSQRQIEERRLHDEQDRQEKRRQDTLKAARARDDDRRARFAQAQVSQPNKSAKTIDTSKGASAPAASQARNPAPTTSQKVIATTGAGAGQRTTKKVATNTLKRAATEHKIQNPVDHHAEYEAARRLGQAGGKLPSGAAKEVLTPPEIQRRGDSEILKPYASDGSVDVRKAVAGGVSDGVLKRAGVSASTLSEIRQNLSDMSRVQPFLKGGEIDLIAVLESDKVSDAVLTRLVGAAPVAKAKLQLDDSKALAPFTTSAGIDLAAAVKGGVSDTVLERATSATPGNLATVRQNISDVAAAKPYTNADGAIDVNAAVASNNVSYTILRRLVGDGAVESAKQRVSDLEAVKPYKNGDNLDLAAAVASNNVSYAILRRLVGDDAVEVAKADLAAVQALTPFMDGARVDLAGAIKAGVSDAVLERVSVPKSAIKEAKQTASDLAAVKEYMDPKGAGIDVEKAVSDNRTPLSVLRRLVGDQQVELAKQRVSDLSLIKPFQKTNGQVDVGAAIDANIDLEALARLGLPTEKPKSDSAVPVAPETILPEHANALRAEFAKAQAAILRGVGPGQDPNNAVRLAALREAEFWREYELDVNGMMTWYQSEARHYEAAIASAESNILANKDRYARGEISKANRDYRNAAWSARIVEQQGLAKANSKSMQDFNRYQTDIKPYIQKVINATRAAVPKIARNEAGATRIADPTRTTRDLLSSINQTGSVSAAIQQGKLSRQEAVSLGVSNVQIDAVKASEVTFGFPKGPPPLPWRATGAVALKADGPVMMTPTEISAEKLELAKEMQAAEVKTLAQAKAKMDEGKKAQEIQQVQRDRQALGKASRAFEAAAKAAPVIAMTSPSAARAASGAATAKMAEERQERRALIAKEGIPAEVGERLSLLESVRHLDGDKPTSKMVQRANRTQAGMRDLDALREYNIPIIQTPGEGIASERQILALREIKDAVQSGQISREQAVELASDVPSAPTAQDMIDGRRRLGNALMAVGAIPLIGIPASIAGTAVTWQDDTAGGKAANVGFTAIGLMPFAGAVVKGGRVAGAATGAARARVIGKEIAATELSIPIINPKQIVKGIAGSIEAVVRPSRIAGAEETFSTLRLSASGDQGHAIKAAMSKPAIELMQTGKTSSAAVEGLPADVTVRAGALHRTLGGNAIHTSPDGRNFLAGGLVVDGVEGGLFVSPTPLTRFAESSAFGKPVELTPGAKALVASGELHDKAIPTVVVFRDPKILKTLEPALDSAGNPKLFHNVAELEAVIPNGTLLPKPNQVLMMRGRAGQRIAVAVIGEPITVAQQAKLKMNGLLQQARNIPKPGVVIRFEGDVGGRMRGSYLLSKADDVREEVDRLRALGLADEALQLERGATRLTQQGRQAIIGRTSTSVRSVRNAKQRIGPSLDRVETRNLDRRTSTRGRDILDGMERGAPARAAGGGDLSNTGRDVVNTRAEDSERTTPRAGIRTSRDSGVESGDRRVRSDLEQTTDPRQRLDPSKAQRVTTEPLRAPDRARIEPGGTPRPPDGRTPIPPPPDGRTPIPPPPDGRTPIPPPPDGRTPIPPPPDGRTPIPPPPDGRTPIPPPPDGRTPIPPPPDGRTPIPPPPMFDTDRENMNDPGRVSELRVVGISRGAVGDTRIDLATGGADTLKDIPQVPDVRTSESFTGLLKDHETIGKAQVIPWGAFNALVTPSGQVTFKPRPGLRRRRRL